MAQDESNSLIGNNPNSYHSLLSGGPLPAINENQNNIPIDTGLNNDNDINDNNYNNNNFNNDNLLNNDINNIDNLNLNINDEINTDFNNLVDEDNNNNNGIGGSWLNNFSSWSMPHLDHASWFCIGIYLVLMIVVPFLRDGSTSIVLGLNCLIFLIYVYWYAWYSTTSVKF